MRPIVIGAGRGSRLLHRTDEVPKTLVEVMGRPMLDWILEALAAAGFSRKDVIFICGYKADVIRSRYPEFTYVENTDWANNNILLSLMCAREHLASGFVSTYADIVYRPSCVSKVVASPHDLVLVCDTKWRSRYVARSQHPETDAEKMRAEGERVVELSRKIASEAAAGEFIGVTKVTPAGAERLLAAFDEARGLFAGKEFREGRSFEKAYLIDLFQWMLERGAPFHRVDTPGGYMELDTLQDLSMAEDWWKAWDEDEPGSASGTPGALPPNLRPPSADPELRRCRRSSSRAWESGSRGKGSRGPRTPRCPTSRCRSHAASWSSWSARRGAESRRRCGSSQVSTSRTRGRSRSPESRCAAWRPRIATSRWCSRGTRCIPT